MADEEEMRARQSIQDYAELARSRMIAPPVPSVPGGTSGGTN